MKQEGTNHNTKVRITINYNNLIKLQITFNNETIYNNFFSTIYKQYNMIKT